MILVGELQFNPSTPRSDKHGTSPKCPYIIQQTGITNTQNNLADVILIQHQILITNKQGNV